MKRFYFAILSLAFAVSLGNSVTSTAQAAAMTPNHKATPCRDKMGKFIKCVPVKPMKKYTVVHESKKAPCRDKMGKFIKCK
jgi:hypothetical protein